MTHVFVNYRKDDGDQAAAAIALDLRQHFGDESVFRASESIKPGTAYPDALVNAIRTSSALLVLVGPRWLSAPGTHGQRALDDENDWVRKEILEGFDTALPVIPVLLGRQMERLAAADLPQPLVRLAWVQSLRFDPQQAPSDLRRIREALTELVPGLSEKARPAAQEAWGSTYNTSEHGDGDGPRFQMRDNSGTITNIGQSSGPVHSGSGDQNISHRTGDRHITNQSGGDGSNFVSGDNHGGINQDFGDSRRRRREEP